jgi:hypothetical protein
MEQAREAPKKLNVFAQMRRESPAIAIRKRPSYPADEAVKKYGPHPEELAKQASRRMDATHGLAVILRDAAKTPLLRMRSEICGVSSTPRPFDSITNASEYWIVRLRGR